MGQQQAYQLIGQIIRKHLPELGYKTFIFGSRAEGTHRKFSDVDVGILGPASVPNKTKFDIEDELEESDIPYQVDVVDFAAVNDRFKRIAMSVTIPL